MCANRTDVFELLAQRHAVVRPALGADESKPILRPVTDEVLHEPVQHGSVSRENRSRQWWTGRRSQCYQHTHTHIHSAHFTAAHTCSQPFVGTTRVSWYQKGKTNLDFYRSKRQ